MLFGWGNRRSSSRRSVAGSVPAVGALSATDRLDAGATLGELSDLGSSVQIGGSVPRTTAVPGEKRDRERVPLEGDVRGEVMVFQPMTIRDISMDGAQIETAFALQLGSLHDFRFSLGDRSVLVKGRIAHCHIGQLTDVTALYRTGVEFVTLTEHARMAIADFVLAARYARSSPSVTDGIIAGESE
jgi:hypothetical protein